MASILREKTVICVCCICGDARDDIADDGSWQNAESLVNKYGMSEVDVEFSRAMCPRCFTHYKEPFIYKFD